MRPGAWIGSDPAVRGCLAAALQEVPLPDRELADWAAAERALQVWGRRSRGQGAAAEGEGRVGLPRQLLRDHALLLQPLMGVRAQDVRCLQVQQQAPLRLLRQQDVPVEGLRVRDQLLPFEEKGLGFQVSLGQELNERSG